MQFQKTCVCEALQMILMQVQALRNTKPQSSGCHTPALSDHRLFGCGNGQSFFSVLEH